MAVITQNQTGYLGQTGVLGVGAAGSAVVAPGMILMLSNQNVSLAQLTCSALGTSANSFGSIAFPTGGISTITLSAPQANMKLIFQKVGATMKLTTSGPDQPVGQNG